MQESRLSHYGDPILLIGTLLEGKTVMVPGGLAVHLVYLLLDRMIAGGFCGTLPGGQLSLFLGRRHGKALLARYSSWPTCMEGVFDKLGQHRNLLIRGFRFLYGSRSMRIPIIIRA